MISKQGTATQDCNGLCGDDADFADDADYGQINLELSLSTMLKALSGSALPFDKLKAASIVERLTAPSLSRGLSKGNSGNKAKGEARRGTECEW